MGVSFSLSRPHSKRSSIRAKISVSGTSIFLYTGQMKTASYHLDIIPDNISHKKWIAFLRDNYLNTLLPLSLVEINGIDIILYEERFIFL